MLRTFQGLHLHQFIDNPLSQFGIPDHLLQFFVEKDMALLPVNGGMRLGKKKARNASK